MDIRAAETFPVEFVELPFLERGQALGLHCRHAGLAFLQVGLRGDLEPRFD